MNRIIAAGIAIFALFVVLALVWPCRASEPAPPPVVRAVRSPPRLGDPSAARGGEEPIDGPMCQAPLPEEQDGATLLGVLLQEPANEGEEAEVTMQMRRCFRGRTKDADPFLILALYRYEEDLGVPPHMRGLFGAILCVESSMRTLTHDKKPLRGDYRDGYAGAWGPLSLHSWAQDSDKCAFTPEGRDDLLASAQCYWSRILVRLDSPFVRAMKCKDPYPLAEALVANQGKYAMQGCRARSQHTLELERWRK